jgi:hypothetical protein
MINNIYRIKITGQQGSTGMANTHSRKLWTPMKVYGKITVDERSLMRSDLRSDDIVSTKACPLIDWSHTTYDEKLEWEANK